jgi:endonuclease/exonuclease/phosphatase family metal-dependent hydrolase
MTVSFRLATLNTWKCEGDYWRRLDAMADGLGNLDLDAVCLQECFAAQSVGADTAAYLGGRLSMALVAAPARHKRREFGEETVLSTSGLAILVRGDIEHHAVLALPSDHADGERIALRVDIRLRGCAFRLVNAHLSHLRGSLGARLRREQADACRTFALDGEPQLACLAGDFNAPLDSPDLAPLFAGRGLDAGPDGPHHLPSTLTRTDGGLSALSSSTPMCPAIDHVVVLGGGGRITTRRLALENAVGPGLMLPSDHAAVVVEVEPASPGAPNMAS